MNKAVDLASANFIFYTVAGKPRSLDACHTSCAKTLKTHCQAHRQERQAVLGLGEKSQTELLR